MYGPLLFIDLPIWFLLLGGFVTEKYRERSEGIFGAYKKLLLLLMLFSFKVVKTLNQLIQILKKPLVFNVT